MIGMLAGRVADEQEDRLIVDVGGVGYEVVVPAYQLQVLRARHLPPEHPRARLKGSGAVVSLYIYCHVPERKPVPVLFGFNEALERRFFELLSGVSRFGPMAAAKSMTISVPEYAGRIMTRDLKGLTQLPGIGTGKAEQIIAQLPGIGTGKAEQIIAQLRSRMAVFAMMPEEKLPERPPAAEDGAAVQVQIALEDLGYRPAEADALIRAARAAHPDAKTLEALLDAVWAVQRRE